VHGITHTLQILVVPAHLFVQIQMQAHGTEARMLEASSRRRSCILPNLFGLEIGALFMPQPLSFGINLAVC
jgi:hypothetical protein